MRRTSYDALALFLTIQFAAAAWLSGCATVEETPVPPASAGVSGATSTSGAGGSGIGGSGAGGSGASSATGGSATGGTGNTGGSGAGSGGTSVGGEAGSSGAGGNAGDGGASGGGAGDGGRGGRNAGGAGSGGAAGLGGSGGGGGGGRGGSAGAGGAITVNKFVGNISTGNSIDTGGMNFSKYWDQLTPENAGKWGSVQSSPSGAFNWATLDAMYNYAEMNGIVFKHHTFVWGSQQPNGTPTLAQVENWIRSYCARYPNTKLIDVVNEPPPHTTPNYTSNLGAGESGTWGWITKAFKLARMHCGNMILILNDYNNIELSNDINRFVDIVTQIKAAGAPIDAVGAQGHATENLSATNLQNNVNSLAMRTGLPVYITEWDIDVANDQQQLSIYQSHFPVFWNTESVKGITIWGWIVGRTWVPNSGLVNGTSPRPAMTWLMQQLSRPVPPN
jgi:endo-1,4-beta-xylanase